MRTYFVLDAEVSETMERQSTIAINKAIEQQDQYFTGYAQGISDVLEFALRRQDWKEIVNALKEIIEREI